MDANRETITRKEIHPSHTMYNYGWIYDEVMCDKCKATVPDMCLQGDVKALRQPCAGSYDLRMDTQRPPWGLWKGTD